MLIAYTRPPGQIFALHKEISTQIMCWQGWVATLIHVQIRLKTFLLCPGSVEATTVSVFT